MTENNDSILSVVSKVFISWAIMEKEDYEPCTNIPELENEFFVKLIKEKLKWAGVDIVIPDALAIILDYCSETPAEVQMITVDILDTILKNNDGSIPKGYVITTNDFSLTFPVKFPITGFFPSAKEEYNQKWDEQKDGGANTYDTLEFWAKYKNT